MSGQKASKILKRLGFTNWIRVEALGFSGGICLLWRNSEFDADYVYSNPQLLHCLVTKRKTRESVLVTGVYGETNPSGRMALWDSLKTISGSLNGPWLVMGDFNIYLSPEEKSRGATPSTQSMGALKDCIIDANLFDLDCVGDRFTREKEGVKERLDWAFCNQSWAAKFPPDSGPTIRLYKNIINLSQIRLPLL